MNDMSQDGFIIRFRGVSDDEAGILAEDLRREILDAAPDVTATRQRANPDAMDFGTIIGLVVGSSAATSVAHGIALWLARNSGVNIQIVSENGYVLADNVSSANAAAMVAAVFTKQRR